VTCTTTPTRRPPRPSSSATTDQTPTWAWTASTDSGVGLAPTTYTVQWSQNSGFASVTGFATSSTNPFTHATDLAEGVWYSRVKAADSLGNESSYSTVGSFTIDLPDPAPVNSNTSTTSKPTTTVEESSGTDPPIETAEESSVVDDSPKIYDITITVLDENGNTVEGARVELYSNPKVAYSDKFGKVTFSNI